MECRGGLWCEVYSWPFVWAVGKAYTVECTVILYCGVYMRPKVKCVEEASSV